MSGHTDPTTVSGPTGEREKGIGYLVISRRMVEQIYPFMS